ncbi:exopolysaccharide biosynthesis polyprenyl glycosylphosphotransferase [Aporhodopirellula aestuarii]|uniref:Exopolysaccharide biosynthesis polyprenyl glycosylphosphotransferase n=1 Tax=Aporhodopirellula aestuarii TaxID=2950107 RepID=A0ABT0UAE6_9BACT|nr:exopolysaccharide biosynthesis polyprenyl glycosylphosphotransferase [Aporhodopirellula aestuarii]MCM2373861.1 exopolysaccharide biosynthesis polyprenyl glycosylphosphotransferase [Aporhodopirellula aestuarii]
MKTDRAEFSRVSAPSQMVGKFGQPTTTAKEFRNNAISFTDFSSQTAGKLGRIQFWKDVQTATPLIVVDWTGSFLATLLGWLVAKSIGWQFAASTTVLLVMIPSVMVLFQSLHGVYPGCGLNASNEFRRSLRSWLMLSASLAVAVVAASPVERSLAHGLWAAYVAFMVSQMLLVCILRPLVRAYLSRFDWWCQPVLIAGDFENSVQLHDSLVEHRAEGLRPAGILYQSHKHWSLAERNSDHRFIGPFDDLEEIMIDQGISRLSVTDPTYKVRQGECFLDSIPNVSLAIDVGDHPTERSRLVGRDGVVEMHCQSILTSFHARAIKTVMDYGIVLLTLPIWLPVMVMLALAVKLADFGPVFYVQERVGQGRKAYKAIKFRSMVRDSDHRLSEYLDRHPELAEEWERTHKLKSDPRITWVGSFLRKTSLDELPQLFNVLRGEMSLVGPRPIIDCHSYDRSYIDDHPDVFRLYQMVKPGITGLWQVSGRNSLPYAKRVELDRYYLRNWSVAFDIFILWRTIKTALLREGAY